MHLAEGTVSAKWVSRPRATKDLSKSLREALREGSSATLGSSLKVPEHPKTTRPEEEDSYCLWEN